MSRGWNDALAFKICAHGIHARRTIELTYTPSFPRIFSGILMRTRFLIVPAVLAAVALPIAVAQPPAESKPSTPPANAAPAAQPAATPAAAPAAAPAEPAKPKKWEIPADAKPVAKQEIEGIVIEDFVLGTGIECKPNSAVVAFYHGTLKADGKVFDSAFDRNDPVPFPLSGVIAGWQKGVPGMKVGGLRRLTIPYALAYGEQGRPPTIPAKADLVFVIELVDVLQSEDISAGTGEEAGPRYVAVTKHIIKTKDGKVVEDRTKEPYIWFPQEMMGMDLGLAGMKVGGKRTLVLPAKMCGTPPGLVTERPSDKDLIIELELIAVRNLPGPAGR